MVENDYEMALLLQKQFEHEAEIDDPKHNLIYAKKKHKNDTKSLTDPSWELIDPTPNIHVLFMAFNEKYFWNKLLSVCVSWSKRMTSCAGVCSYQGRGGLCHITLSEPLLKLRPRKDLVETLLHEMIHAYLFVTHNNKDRDGHGPEFHKHMYRINLEAGTSISVYHSFHDEVSLYQQHWWRCNGPCQHQKPYFGTVRRATNRAPGPYDRWWAQHQQTCGGTFIKVKEPEKTKKSTQKENKPVDPKKDIRKYFPAQNKTSGTQIRNSSSTIVITKTSSNSHDANKNTNLIEKPPIITPFQGSGHILSTTSTQSSNSSDYRTVRNHWANKFPQKRSAQDTVIQKRIKNDNNVNCPICQSNLPADEINNHLDLCLLNDIKAASTSNIDVEEKVICLVCSKKVMKRTLNEHLDECMTDSVFNNSDVIEISSDNEEIFNKNCDNSDEVFRENCGKTDKMYNCHNSNLDLCLLNDIKGASTSSIDVEEKVVCLVCSKKVIKRTLSEHLDECMTDSVFNNSDVIEISSDNEEISNKNCDNSDKEFREECGRNDKLYNCPICCQEIPLPNMSAHLELCLSKDDFSNSFFDEDF